MSDFSQKLIASLLTLSAGLGLMLFGLFAAHQSVWSAGGLFFVVVGVSALVLTIAPAAPGRPGALLRSPGLSVLLLAAVAASLCYAVMVALLRR